MKHPAHAETRNDEGFSAVESLAALFIVALVTTSFLLMLGRAAKSTNSQIADTSAHALAQEISGKAEAYSCGAATGAEPLFADSTSAAACASIGANLPAGELGAVFTRSGDTFAARIDQEWIRPQSLTACKDLAGLNPRLVAQSIYIRYSHVGGVWDPTTGLPGSVATAADLDSTNMASVIAVPDRAPYLPSASRSVIISNAPAGQVWQATPAGGETVYQRPDANGCVWFPWLPPIDVAVSGGGFTSTLDLTDQSQCVTNGSTAGDCSLVPTLPGAGTTEEIVTGPGGVFLPTPFFDDLTSVLDAGSVNTDGTVDGIGSPTGPVIGATPGVDAADPIFVDHQGVDLLWTPARAQNTATVVSYSMPAAAPWDLRFDLDPETWAPPIARQFMSGEFFATLNPDSSVTFSYADTAAVFPQITTAALSSSGRQHLRWTHDPATGASTVYVRSPGPALSSDAGWVETVSAAIPNGTNQQQSAGVAAAMNSSIGQGVTGQHWRGTVLRATLATPSAPVFDLFPHRDHTNGAASLSWLDPQSNAWAVTQTVNPAPGHATADVFTKDTFIFEQAGGTWIDLPVRNTTDVADWTYTAVMAFEVEETAANTGNRRLLSAETGAPQYGWNLNTGTAGDQCELNITGTAGSVTQAVPGSNALHDVIICAVVIDAGQAFAWSHTGGPSPAIDATVFAAVAGTPRIGSRAAAAGGGLGPHFKLYETQEFSTALSPGELQTVANSLLSQWSDSYGGPITTDPNPTPPTAEAFNVIDVSTLVSPTGPFPDSTTAVMGSANTVFTASTPLTRTAVTASFAAFDGTSSATSTLSGAPTPVTDTDLTVRTRVLAPTTTISVAGMHTAAASPDAPGLAWTPAGAVFAFHDASSALRQAVVPLTALGNPSPGTPIWLRIQYVMNNTGSTTYTVLYSHDLTSNVSEVNWVTGSTGTFGVLVSMTPGTGIHPTLGASPAGLNNLDGVVYYYAQSFDGTLFSKADPASDATPASTTFTTATTGETWLLTPTAVTGETATKPVTVFTGASGNHVSLASTPATQISDHLRASIEIVDLSWTAATQTLISKYGASGNQAWLLAVDNAGTPTFWVTDPSDVSFSASGGHLPEGFTGTVDFSFNTGQVVIRSKAAGTGYWEVEYDNTTSITSLNVTTTAPIQIAGSNGSTPGHFATTGAVIYSDAAGTGSVNPVAIYNPANPQTWVTATANPAAVTFSRSRQVWFNQAGVTRIATDPGRSNLDGASADYSAVLVFEVDQTAINVGWKRLLSTETAANIGWSLSTGSSGNQCRVTIGGSGGSGGVSAVDTFNSHTLVICAIILDEGQGYVWSQTGGRSPVVDYSTWATNFEPPVVGARKDTGSLGAEFEFLELREYAQALTDAQLLTLGTELVSKWTPTLPATSPALEPAP